MAEVRNPRRVFRRTHCQERLDRSNGQYPWAYGSHAWRHRSRIASRSTPPPESGTCKACKLWFRSNTSSIFRLQNQIWKIILLLLLVWLFGLRMSRECYKGAVARRWEVQDLKTESELIENALTLCNWFRYRLHWKLIKEFKRKKMGS